MLGILRLALGRAAPADSLRMTGGVRGIVFAALKGRSSTGNTKGHADLINVAFSILMRRRPTLPYTFAYSTIGPAGLNFRVRDGNGWNPRGKITANLAVSS